MTEVSERLRWIGRKSKEFKVGDIIRRYQNEFREVHWVSKTGKTIRVFGGERVTEVFRSSQCSLVCPAELRCDEYI